MFFGLVYKARMLSSERYGEIENSVIPFRIQGIHATHQHLQKSFVFPEEALKLSVKVKL